MLNLQDETKFCFSKIFHFKFIFQVIYCFCGSLGVLTRFKSSTYTTIITNLVFDFLMKMHGHVALFKYPSFSKYSLRRLYHMRLDCFNPYKDHCNLIEYMLQGFVLFASGNLNPLGIFMYISLSMDPYKYAVITSMRPIFSLSETTKLIKKQNVIASMTGEYVSS